MNPEHFMVIVVPLAVPKLTIIDVKYILMSRSYILESRSYILESRSYILVSGLLL